MRITGLLLFLFFNTGTLLQGQVSIYKTAADFPANDSLLHCRHCRLQLHELFHRQTIGVNCKGKKAVYLKSDIYGYRNREGNDYRLQGDLAYQVLNPGDSLLLYKITSGTGLKNDPVCDRFFFSRNKSTPVLSLSLESLQVAFVGNPRFLAMLQLSFIANDQLIAYGPMPLAHQLNRLLLLSRQYN